MTATQTARVLEILGDGDWHCSADIMRATWITRVAARVHDVRKLGIDIEREMRPGPGEKWWAWYRLAPAEAQTRMMV